MTETEVHEIGNGSLRTHAKAACDGEFCCIHNPSKHPLSDGLLWWRSDRGLMERICVHGIGHPDPDDLAFKRRTGRYADGAHGCDGCCR